MAYYDALITKWPTVSGATSAAKLTNLRAEKVAGAAIPLLVPSWQVYDLINQTEFAALTAANQTRIRDILSQGTINLSSGKRARSELIALFTNASGATRVALAALVASYDSPQVSWLSANGYPETLNENDLKAAGLI